MKEKIYIAGAHSRSQTLGVYLTKLNPDLQIEAYLVNNEEKNEEEIKGVPVLRFDEKTKLHTEYPVYLGTRGIYHAKLTEELSRLGMSKIIPVTPQLDMELRNRFLKIYLAEQGKRYQKLEELPASVCLYVVKSAFDKPLQQGGYCLTKYEQEIQVGADLTEQRICELFDNAGENISARNKQFCELTALYWIWKNAKEEVVGLEHYRRHFLLPEDWYATMAHNGVDVILPTPLYVSPGLAQNYKDRHIASDWEFMMEYIKRNYPVDYDAAVRFFEDGLYSPCNMFIMRKPVLDDLCRWLFPILFACAEHGGEREDGYQNRYPGFLSERLVSFFFDKNKEKYKLVYADKNFLQ